MNQTQQQLRHFATQEFLKSLHQLEQMLQSESHPSVIDPGVAKDATFIDMSAFDEAVADIEEYMEHNQGNR
ncbi:MAG: hypothetical protein VKL59_22770 [Nostocaceae cyanobacterium]|nr:hypothetical protein [Nostocaceae cyanobacterium]